jgi:NADH:ubiquinone oxidoreductase subunit K
MNVGLHHFLIVAAVMFSLGVYVVATRRNAVAVLMGVELILNAANLNFAAFSRYVTGTVGGQVFVLFVIVLAACEAAVALAIILAFFRQLRTVDVREADKLRG